MGCLGTHFSITEQEAQDLRSRSSDEQRIDLVFDIEERYYTSAKEFIAESDKSWDGMHRALTDGLFDFGNGDYPLSHVVMGGERLYEGTSWIVVMKSPTEVRDTALALQGIDEADFRSRYWRIPQRKCDWDLSDDDCSYTWEYFLGVRALFCEAAKTGRHVLFVASQ